ncbi:MAG: phosphoadenosine phosphosulfate reductase family protein [Gammaproteobacteria bacterium]|nr:phosphoadenosine phosphosulfate reductase family protein [Gammaproteobacteria bacterium]
MIDRTLFGDIDIVQVAIDLLQELEPPEGYYLAFSGGKDSVVIKELANMAGVKYDAHYNLTTIDPPELVYFIRDYHPDVIIDRPEMPLLKMLAKKGFSQRQRRWCCAKYKERGGKGRYILTGIRYAESSGRKIRGQVETCYNDKSKQFVHPIIGWSDSQVWRFIEKHNLPYCKLYDEGWKRVGCLFCPLAGSHRKTEVELYPKYKDAFIRAFKRLYDAKKAEGKTSVDRWKDGEEMFWWWIREDRKSDDPDQTVLFE